jgi:transposase
MVPLADRLLDALGDSTTRDVLRTVLAGGASQREIASRIDRDQATVSRGLGRLRDLGLIAQRTPRAQTIEVIAPDQIAAILRAADRLAEHLLEIETDAQAERSKSTTKAVVRPVSRDSGERSA